MQEPTLRLILCQRFVLWREAWFECLDVFVFFFGIFWHASLSTLSTVEFVFAQFSQILIVDDTNLLLLLR